MTVEMRASDDDRHRVVAALQRHTEAGRLTLEEFGERVGAVYAARTLGELTQVVRDLPAEPAEPPPSTADTGRQLLVAFAVAVVFLVLLGLVMVLK